MSIIMGIIFAIIWAALGLIGFFRCLRLDKDAGFVPSRKEYIYLIPAWALIGPFGLALVVFGAKRW